MARLQFQLNGALAVGNVIVIEVVQSHVLAWEITHFSDSKTALLVLFLLTVTWTGTYSIDEVCNFPCQNMTVTPKIAPAFTLLYHSRFQRHANAPFELANAPFQTKTNAKNCL